MNSEDIFGVTLGELSFIILFVVLIFLAKSLHNSNEDIIEKYKRQLDEVNNKIAVLEDENKKLADELQKLKSNIPPGCREKYRKGYVGNFYGDKFTIIDSDVYHYNNKNFNYHELINYLADDLKNAEEHGCFLQIQVGFNKNISTNEFVTAKSKLDKHFYVTVTAN